MHLLLFCCTHAHFAVVILLGLLKPLKSQRFSTCSFDLLNNRYYTSGVLAMSSFSMWKLCPCGNRNVPTEIGNIQIRDTLCNSTCAYADGDVLVQRYVLQCTTQVCSGRPALHASALSVRLGISDSLHVPDVPCSKPMMFRIQQI